MFARLSAAVRGFFARQQQIYEVNDSQSTEQSVPPPKSAPHQGDRESPLDLNQCTVEWDKDDQQQVGDYSVATVKLTRQNGASYSFKAEDHFSCKITDSTSSNTPYTVEPDHLVGHGMFKVSFQPTIAGTYSVDIKINHRAIGGTAVIERTYKPGPIDGSRTVVMDFTDPLIAVSSELPLKVIPKDSYGNEIDISQKLVLLNIKEDSAAKGEGDYYELDVCKEPWIDYYVVQLQLPMCGHHVVRIMCDGNVIGPKFFSVIYLAGEEVETFTEGVGRVGEGKRLSFKATMLKNNRRTKVACNITPKLLEVRELLVNIQCRRLYACRISPTSKFVFDKEPGVFRLLNGCQEEIKLHSPQRNTMGAMFYEIMLHNIGGSETFEKKQKFFFDQLLEYHKVSPQREILLTVERSNLLDSFIKATKNFSHNDWKKRFKIHFEGEEGLDYGGLSREMFVLLSTELFNSRDGYFIRFNLDNQQALVHPNHKRSLPDDYKVFKLAGKICGKCLYESALNNPLLLKARFTRSFLAQLIGLTINHKYFETDDPDLFETKIKYILENDVSDLDMDFTEEEFDSVSHEQQVVPLIKNGTKIKVTEKNKRSYLDELAHYRLTTKGKKQIESFIRGLTKFVPLHFLNVFTENEIELVLCGTDEVTYDDMKRHSKEDTSGSITSCNTLAWFWTIIRGFTKDEMAKLLQFTTGSSLLPSGGFKALDPPFTVILAPTRGGLPTAHTCFNQLCLPKYSSSKELHEALKTALTEGLVGFQQL